MEYLSMYRCSMVLGMLVALLQVGQVTADDTDDGVEIIEPPGPTLGATPGGSLLIKCASQGPVRWYHNGMPLYDTVPRTAITIARHPHTGQQLSMLMRSRVDENDAGRYTCRDVEDYFNYDFIIVSVEQDETDPSVRIIEPGDEFVEVPLGGVVTLRCEAPATSSLTWLHDGKLLSTNLQSRIVITTGVHATRRTSVLTRTSMMLSDSGLYACKDSDVSTNRDDVRVNVTDALEVVSSREEEDDDEEHSVDMTLPVGATTRVTAGQTFSVMCHGVPNILWLHNGLAVEEDDRTRIVARENDMTGLPGSTLIRTNMNVADAGQYVCRDINDYYNSDNIHVTVIPVASGQERVTIVDPPTEELTVPLGGSFTLRCQANRGATLNWWQGSELLEESVESRVMTTSMVDMTNGVMTSLLTRQNVVEGDSGAYTCRDANVVNNEDYRDSIRVTVARHMQPLDTMLPTPTATRNIDVEIVLPRDDVFTVTSGGQFTIKCRGGQQSTLIWQHNGHRITNTARTTVTTNREADGMVVTLLRTTHVAESDAGMYKCQNQQDYFDNDEIRVTVTSFLLASEVSVLPRMLVVPPGGRIDLRCDAPRGVTLSWSHNARPITSGGRIAIASLINADRQRSISAFTKTGVTVDDSGFYACRDQNDFFNLDGAFVVVR